MMKFAMNKTVAALLVSGAMLTAAPTFAQSSDLDATVAKVGTTEAQANKRDGRKPTEIEATRNLNAEMASKTKADVDTFNAQQADAQSKHQAEVAAYEAAVKARDEKVARDKADYDTRMAEYQRLLADRDACIAGDKKRCASVTTTTPAN